MCNSIDIYLDLMKRKLQWFQDMMTLTLAQYDLIEQEDYTGLVSNLEHREKFMKEIVVANNDLNNISLGDFSSDEIAEINEIKSKIVEIKEKMVYHNSILQDKVLEKREECKNEIKDIHINEKAARGYGHWDYKRESSFFDTKN